MNVSSPQRLTDLVNDLLRRDEAPWVEFKHNNADPQRIGVLASAISNAARIAGQHSGYIIWGIEDRTQAIVGTNFDPDAHTVGNQVFAMWLAPRLSPSIAFQFDTIVYAQARVVLMEIPAATYTPDAFDSLAYIRIRSATPKLTDYPQRYQELLSALRPYPWEHRIALAYVSSDDILNQIDYTHYFRLTKQPLPDNRAGILERLNADQLITEDVGGKWNITNLGAMLFEVDLTQFLSALARKGIRFVGHAGAALRPLHIGMTSSRAMHRALKASSLLSTTCFLRMSISGKRYARSIHFSPNWPFASSWRTLSFTKT